ncbi:helix-turn-helix transcriptional regulator [Fulvivirgaceae bacterium BMA12]|uniref:Helix-turn-helix transcriptional regulator n=1 Tax=Agaribacillus aureus TaxID=3051825 RepID=A0ABT8L3C9_9BACT|nr:helix-turn-helix transcriptional regulator [Fulvivirgaceae bacterium BMA12]
MKRYTLSEAEDKLIGLKGSPERDQYEFELKLELIGDTIKRARKRRCLTQEQLGKLIGVKKAQISRLENSTGNVTIETILKVFNALEAKVNFNVQMLNRGDRLLSK